MVSGSVLYLLKRGWWWWWGRWRILIYTHGFWQQLKSESNQSLSGSVDLGHHNGIWLQHRPWTSHTIKMVSGGSMNFGKNHSSPQRSCTDRSGSMSGDRENSRLLYVVVACWQQQGCILLCLPQLLFAMLVPTLLLVLLPSITVSLFYHLFPQFHETAS